MYSSKGQWFLIASALLIIVLASLYHYKHSATGEIANFEESLVEKEEFFLSDFLAENFENNLSSLKKTLVIANELLAEESGEKGFNVSLFLFCIFNNSRTLLAFTSFDNANVSICSESCLNFSLGKNEFFTQNFTGENLVTTFIYLNDGELCVNHTFKTDFCAGVFMLFDGKNRYIGKTLNLNSC